jgi:hypothetical protein
MPARKGKPKSGKPAQRQFAAKDSRHEEGKFFVQEIPIEAADIVQNKTAISEVLKSLPPPR